MAFSDLVILLPGISGSTLSKDGKILWGTDTGGIWRMLTTGGDSVRSLKLQHGDDAELDDIDGVVATSLVQDLHVIPGLWKIDGYTRIRRHLISELALRPGENFFEFPYDWRRDNRVASRKLGHFARQKLKAWQATSGATGAKLVLVAHSMGGLVARGFMDGPEQGWRETRTLVTIGTPHRGSLNALGFLTNGFVKGVGPAKLDLSDTLRSFTGVYQLLPRFACIDRGDGTIVRAGQVAGLPHVDPERAKAALNFYELLESWHEETVAAPGYECEGPSWHLVTGTFQRTMLSARLTGGAMTLLETLGDGMDGGDGTVPRVSAMPTHMERAPVGMFANQVHGSLQNDDAVLSHITAVLAGLAIDEEKYRASFKIAFDVDDAYEAGAPVQLRATVEPFLPKLDVDLFDATRLPDSGDARVGTVTLVVQGNGVLVGETMLAPGAYRAVAAAGNATVTDCFLVLNEAG